MADSGTMRRNRQRINTQYWLGRFERSGRYVPDHPQVERLVRHGVDRKIAEAHLRHKKKRGETNG